MATNKIEMPDGSTFKDQKEPPVEVLPGFNTTRPATTQAEQPARTRLQIATELDAAEHDVATAKNNVVLSSAEVARLTVELRNFGKKTRAKKLPSI